MKLEPDLVLSLAAPAEVAFERIEGQSVPDSFEDELQTQRVKGEFEQMVHVPTRVSVDATRSSDHRVNQAMTALIAAGLQEPTGGRPRSRPRVREGASPLRWVRSHQRAQPSHRPANLSPPRVSGQLCPEESG
jgi:hypothetical protein